MNTVIAGIGGHDPHQLADPDLLQPDPRVRGRLLQQGPMGLRFQS